MRKFFLFPLILILIFPEYIISLPRFALRSGANCVDCHFNPTGGQMRSNRGWNMSRKGLTMGPTDESFEMSNRLGKNVLFGLDLRGQLLQRTTESSDRLDFQRMSGLVYGGIELSEKLKIYGRYDFINNVYEGYAVAHVLPNNSYLKGGVFSPNYGIRLDDHTAYTRGGDMGFLFSTGRRQGNIYDPYYTESGVEAGFYLSDWGFVTASVGNPRIQLFAADPTYTVSAQITPQLDEEFHLMFGASAANYKKANNLNPLFNNVWSYAPFAGISAGGFTLLAEMDFMKSYIAIDSMTTAVMIEASYHLIKGIEAVVRYDRFDPLTTRSNDDVSRIIIGLEMFPYSFIEIRPQYRIQMEDPAVKNNSIVVQAHIFY